VRCAAFEIRWGFDDGSDPGAVKRGLCLQSWGMGNSIFLLPSLIRPDSLHESLQVSGIVIEAA
jgi:hypothetical protein